jgi:hypoxanthine phosphoribosyltransferase
VTDTTAEDRLERLLSRREIEEAVRRLAAELDRDYAGLEPLLVGVLRGAFIFLADLVRQVRTPVGIDFMRITSYEEGTQTSGRPRVAAGLPREAISGRHVVMVEDMVDTGLTTRAALRHLGRSRPASLRVCALLDKPERRRVPVRIDYLGLTVPDRFLVGYGLDLDGRHRQLPDIYAVERE